MSKPLPTDLFAGIEVLEATDEATVASIAIPLASLPGLTAAEASPTTGDARELMLALITAAYLEHSTLPDPSTKMQIQRSEVATGDATRRLDYSISFFVEVPTTAYAMQAEPAS
jgi:hypothetical protein